LRSGTASRGDQAFKVARERCIAAGGKHWLMRSGRRMYLTPACVSSVICHIELSNIMSNVRRLRLRQRLGFQCAFDSKELKSLNVTTAFEAPSTTDLSASTGGPLRLWRRSRRGRGFSAPAGNLMKVTPPSGFTNEVPCGPACFA
jgi:hypothetical protein